MCVSICCGNQSIHSTSQHLSSVTFFDSFFNLPEDVIIKSVFFIIHMCDTGFVNVFSLPTLIFLPY